MPPIQHLTSIIAVSCVLLASTSPGLAAEQARADTVPAIIAHRLQAWAGTTGPGSVLPEDLLPLPAPAPDDAAAVRWLHVTSLQFRPSPRLTATGRVVVDSDPARDPTVRQRDYDQIDAAVTVPLATLDYEDGPLLVRLGRTFRRWGPGWTGSLALDAYRPPADGLELAWRTDRWSARYLFERLDDGPVAATDGDGRPNRYLSAHRLDVRLHPGLRLGLSETAVHASRGAPAFWALNPLLPFVLAQQERDSGDLVANAMWSCDLVWETGTRTAFYGQFLLDDYQIDAGDREIYPDQLGWLAGFVWCGDPDGIPLAFSRSRARLHPGAGAGLPPGRVHRARADACTRGDRCPATRPPQPGLAAGIEYARIGSWTYLHRDPAVRYVGWDAPLGHPLGPDSDAFSAFLEWRRDPDWPRVVLAGRRLRQGSNTIGTTDSPTGNVGQPYPLGTVHRTDQLALIVTGEGPGGSGWEVRGGLVDVRRVRGVPTGSLAEEEPSGLVRGRDLATGTTWWASCSVTIPLGSWSFGL